MIEFLKQIAIFATNNLNKCRNSDLFYMTDVTINGLVEILHREKCSCVIFNKGKITLCHERGVKDLLSLLESDREVLSGACVADKVIGKGAAALMILGGVKSIYADVISLPAFELLSTASIPVSYEISVPNIINRAGDGVCPVETLCRNCLSAEECLPLIRQFVLSINEMSE